MQTSIPSTGTILKSLLRADLTTQWRNRKSFILILVVPVIILYSWRPLVGKFGAAYILATAITIGLTAIGLMGYSNSIARDREKGVFQRLRVAPVPRWSIMGSRLVVQLVMILLVVLSVYLGGYYFDHITLSVAGYLVTLCTALIGGAVYLCTGQVIVGMVKNPETVNAVSRMVYFVFIFVGMLGQTGQLGAMTKQAVQWSPYGTVQTILAHGMELSGWTQETTWALLATIGYSIVFAVIGIRNFKWSTK